MTRQRICSTAGIIFGLAVSCACQVALAAEPKRVMLLHSFGREFRPWSEYAKTIRNELGRQSPWPLEIVEHSLLMAEFRDENADLAFVDYLRALHTRHSLDLIMSLGAPAAGFVQRHRERLFPITPMVLTALGGIFGQETVGGPMHSVIEGSRQTVAVAIRILEGEKAADIKVPAIGFATPQFNWREMQRWGIPRAACRREARFTFATQPHGSSIVNRFWRSLPCSYYRAR
jgi:hypothetical protein